MFLAVLFVPVVAGDVFLESSFHHFPEIIERSGFTKTYGIFEPCYLNKRGNRNVSCAQLRRKGEDFNDAFDINPHTKFRVNCDMKTDGGGWTTIQRRGRYEYKENFFEKSEDEYKKGFGEAFESYWIGNTNLHALTAFPNNNQVLRIELTTKDGHNITVEYDRFEVGSEADKYKLTIGKYKGLEGYDALGPQSGHGFIIGSRQYTDNYRGCYTIQSGGWWGSDCFRSNLNGQRFTSDPNNENKKGLGITWTKDGDTTSKNDNYELVEMKIRDADFKFCSGKMAN